jgi:hypothetical protein
MANYTKEKSRYGGCAGLILVHSTPGIGSINDPLSSTFRNKIPAGYLKCDGSVQNAREFYALSQILGVGDDCRFKKENVSLRNADVTQNDLGQFQLPDLGSKVILAGKDSGTYTATTVESQQTVAGANPLNKVGAEVEVISNVGNRANVSYLGNFDISASIDKALSGNSKFLLNTVTSSTTLDIENFQSHAHNSVGQSYLTYSANHATYPGGDVLNNAFTANSGSGNELETTAVNTTQASIHRHKIAKPISYTQTFQYGHTAFTASAENIVSYIDLKLSNVKKLDQVVTPFILVEYIIKF